MNIFRTSGRHSSFFVRLIGLVLAAVLLFSRPGLSLSASAAEKETTATEIGEVVSRTLAAAMVRDGASTLQEWVNGGLTLRAGAGAEWMILTLKKLGAAVDYSGYLQALKEKTETQTGVNATGLQREALILVLLDDDSDFIQTTAAETPGALGVMSWIYGLHLTTNLSKESEAKAIVTTLLSLRCDGRGWAVNGENPDPDVTAMAITALAPYAESMEEVKEAVETALSVLSGLQVEETAGYRSYGYENAESVSQVILAMASIGRDIAAEEDFAKNGATAIDALLAYELPDGGFSHLAGGEYNGTATNQAAYALTGYLLNTWGAGRLFDFSETELPMAAKDIWVRAEELAQKALADETAGETIPTQTTEPQTEAETEGSDAGSANAVLPAGKIAALGILAGVAVLLLLILLITKRVNAKNLIGIVLLLAAGCFVILKIQIATPGNYYGNGTAVSGKTVTTTIEIRCDAVAGEADHIPADGVILAKTEIVLNEGATAYDQLVEAAKLYEISVESRAGTSYGSAYIPGIQYLYEYDYGDLSGWMYSVNHAFASVGCGEYILEDGDTVLWQYTREIGKDIEP